jgi:dienelactone hydrolase
MLLAVLFIWGWRLSSFVSPQSTLAPAILGSAELALALAVAAALVVALAIVARVPWHARLVAVAGFVLLALSIDEVLGLKRSTVVVTALLAASCLVGAVVATLVRVGWPKMRIWSRTKIGGWALVAFGLAAAVTVWLVDGGSPRARIPQVRTEEARSNAPADLDDPAQDGPFPVESLSYGSGTDRLRAEFAGNVRLQTKTVDASGMLNGWEGFTGWARSAYFGFDPSNLPLNGRVWYPRGQGPFPLVLVVHGNHPASKFSDAGYAYLGRHLASHGYICASVDENFLNFMETDFRRGLARENNTRAWLLLEHLRVWHEWNEDPQNPFFRRVDTRRIALVGHSRGGESVAHAAAFNHLPFCPDNAAVKFDYGYHIRGVVAIAPTDGMYRPAGTFTTLEDLNYLTLQGSHDADVHSFAGLFQYGRVRFTGRDECFKSAVYIYGANHVGFNTSWGANDVGSGIADAMLNKLSVLPAAEQRRIAMVYVTAFLECTLRDRDEYRPLFQNALYGKSWLPETHYLTQYADSMMHDLCTFDEDINLATATTPGGTTAADHLTEWYEAPVELRNGANLDRAVVLGWDRGRERGDAYYAVSWPAGSLELNDDSVLVLNLADADTDSDKPAHEPLDLTIEVVDADQRVARLPLGHFARLQPPIETPVMKANWLQGFALSESIGQTFLFPLAEFRKVNSAFDPERACSLRLVFDRSPSGMVILNHVAFGVRRAPLPFELSPARRAPTHWRPDRSTRRTKAG